MKRLIDYALNQPLFILLGTLLFVMSGVFAFKNLSVEAFPDVTDTQVTVIALYPGRAAEEVEKEVSLPIEVALSGLPNSIRVFSHTQFGLSFTVVTYDDKAEVNLARQQVNERLNGVDLPPGVQAGEHVVKENSLLLAREFRNAQDEALQHTPAPGSATPAIGAGSK